MKTTANWPHTHTKRKYTSLTYKHKYTYETQVGHTKLPSKVYMRLLSTRWGELEHESGLQVVHQTGCLYIGKKGTTSENAVNNYAVVMTAKNIPWVSHLGPLKWDSD